MSHYLLSVHAGEGQPREQPKPEQMQEFMQRVVALEADMEERGAWVFGGRLSAPDAATVVRMGDGGAEETAGPFGDAAARTAGFYIIEAADRDEALDWARRVVEAVGAPIEVRPFAASGKVADHMPAG